METSYNDLLLQILAIMRYKNEEKFVKDFVEMNHVEAMIQCIEKLPRKEQEALRKKQDDPEEFKRYISQDRYKEEFNHISTKALFDFLHHMEPILQQDQKDQITQLLNAY